MKIKNIKESKLEKFKFISSILSPSVILAGGALRSLIDKDSEILDLDLFFVNVVGLNKKTIKNQIEAKITKEMAYEKIFQCQKDELRSFINPDPEKYPKIQLIDLKSKFYKNPEDVINEFDINAGRIAYDGEIFYVSFAAVRDIMHKHISLNKLTYPISTIKRIAKYSQKGYNTTIAAMDFVRMVREIEGDFDETVYVD